MRMGLSCVKTLWIHGLNSHTSTCFQSSVHHYSVDIPNYWMNNIPIFYNNSLFHYMISRLSSGSMLEEISSSNCPQSSQQTSRKIIRRQKKERKGRYMEMTTDEASQLLRNCTKNERKFMEKLSFSSNLSKWLCKCGKMYSCYPSLFYHFKNKHPNEVIDTSFRKYST